MEYSSVLLPDREGSVSVWRSNSIPNTHSKATRLNATGLLGLSYRCGSFTRKDSVRLNNCPDPGRRWTAVSRLSWGWLSDRHQCLTSSNLCMPPKVRIYTVDLLIQDWCQSQFTTFGFRWLRGFIDVSSCKDVSPAADVNTPTTANIPSVVYITASVWMSSEAAPAVIGLRVP